MKEKRNGIISLWKFLFAIVIVFYHGARFYDKNSNPFFYGGYIAVEFFFVVSGFYLAKKALNNFEESSTKEMYKYLIKSIKKLAPYILISFIFALLIELKFNSLKKHDLINSIYSLLLLRQTGIRAPSFFGYTWYIGVMFISIIILYPLFHKYKEKFIKYISILIIMIGVGYMSQNYGTLNLYATEWNGFFFGGTLRGIVEMNIGAVIYLLSKYINNFEFTRAGNIILTIVGEFLMIFVLIIINYATNPTNYDFSMLLFISISILIFSLGKGLEYKLLSNNLFYYLEKLSMPLYLNHYFLITIINLAEPFSTINPVNQSLLAVIISIIFSIIEMKLIDSLNKYNITYHLKKVFIKC